MYAVYDLQPVYAMHCDVYASYDLHYYNCMVSYDVYYVLFCGADGLKEALMAAQPARPWRGRYSSWLLSEGKICLQG